jgi:hypothetical protein
MKMPKVTRRSFLGAGAVFAGMTVSGCATGRNEIMPAEPANLPYVAHLRVRKPGSIRMLQLTDIHFFGGEPPFWDATNKTTMQNMQALVAATEPDLLLVTGDVWRDKPHERLDEFARYGIAQCAALGVPWAYVWGNHDQVNDRAAIEELLTKSPNSLYRGGGSGGNYVLNLEDRHGRVLWQFLCVNTETTGMLAGQQAWLKSLPNAINGGSRNVPQRMAAFHIPLKQYGTVWAEGVARGIKCERVCSEREDGSSLAVLKELGVKACLCGHDHVNDYSGAVDGVDLIYGRATGVGSYGGMQVRKGGKLYTLNGHSGKYRWESVLNDGAHWVPGPDERTDKTPADKK